MALIREGLRVCNHIARAERFARGNKRRIDPLRRLTRALLLDELTRYRHSFRFPRNRDFHGKQVPYFVDADGTRCAVAHLLEIGGQSELVRKIARERNHATVRELANESALLAWLEAAGLTVEEAARIQPSYCYSNADECLCQSIYGQIRAVAEGTVIQQSSPPTYADGVVQIQSIDGDAGSFVVGQQYPAANVQAEVGSRVVLAVALPPAIGDAAPSTVLSALRLSLGDTTVTCGTAFGKAHPIPKDVAYRALMTSTSEQCGRVLAEANPDWAHTTCSGSGWGCGFASAVGVAPATTLAIAAALLCYRSRRRLRALDRSGGRC